MSRTNGCAVAGTGALSCWGSDAYGSLGRGGVSGINTAAPTVPPVSNAVAVSVGAYHSCAALTTGGVVCFGYNLESEIGDGTTMQRNAPTPVLNLP